MELIIPLAFSILAFILFILALMFGYLYNSDELYFLCMIFTTIMFFVSGAMWLGVTHVNPVTGTTVADAGTYDFLVWLFIVLGFIPILLMYEYGFGKSEGD
jgi:hypothetical protein